MAAPVGAATKAASMESISEGTATAVKPTAETACVKATPGRASAIPTKRPERSTAAKSPRK